MQVCVSKCQNAFCKKLAEDVEFEFEMAGDFLLPPCKASKLLAKKELRLSFSGKKSQVQVELLCEGGQTCLSQDYDDSMKGAALVAKVVADVKAAVKHFKPFVSPPLVASVPKVSPPPKDEEWDRVVVAPARVPKITEVETAVVAPTKNAIKGITSLSFGGEAWNYTFSPDQGVKRVGDIHSRIYPRIVLSGSYWPWSFMRLSASLGGSMSTLRLQANQPIDGDGQIVSMRIVQSSVVSGFFLGIGSYVKVGADLGYDFQGAFTDKQRLLDREVTVVPSYQSHGLRLGPRVTLGEGSEVGTIDLAAAFYPYIYYAEYPDEPTSEKTLWSMGFSGLFRLMLSSELFLDATLRMQAFYVRYSQLALRETADGEKWGSGQVTNMTTSVAVGLGWLF